MKRLNPYIHYQNKTKTKHYYQMHIFNNDEWDRFIHGELVQKTRIAISSKYRKCPDTCDRHHKIDGKIVKCENKPFYKSIFNMYFCKACAREINNESSTASFTKIERSKP